MKSWMGRIFSSNVYIRVATSHVRFQDCWSGEILDIPATMEIAERPDGKNAFVVSTGDGERRAAPPDAVTRRINPFDHPRMLLADFEAAEQFLRYGLRRLLKWKWFRPSPMIMIHPLEKLDGGIAALERRAWHDICLHAGARRVVVHVGDELQPQQVNRMLEEAGATQTGNFRPWSK